ncbi:hypothetical protein VTN02DRAFT_2262 [Thermoascus thermophilus]
MPPRQSPRTPRAQLQSNKRPDPPAIPSANPVAEESTPSGISSSVTDPLDQTPGPQKPEPPSYTMKDLMNLSQAELDALEQELCRRSEAQRQRRRILAYQDELRQEVQGDSLPEVPRGKKRPREDSPPLTHGPPEVPVKEYYRGRNLHEYDAFLIRLKNHFRIHQWWYDAADPDQRRIDAAISVFDDAHILLWDAHVEVIGGIGQTSWPEFKAWLEGLIQHPELLRQEAGVQYAQARQLEGQSVREFAASLRPWERRLAHLLSFTDEHRIAHLEARVLPIVREESYKYPQKPKTYEAYVAHLQKVEDNIPGRVTARTTGRYPEKNPLSSSRNNPHVRSRRRRSHY